jgi:hypothetical protein
VLSPVRSLSNPKAGFFHAEPLCIIGGQSAADALVHHQQAVVREIPIIHSDQLDVSSVATRTPLSVRDRIMPSDIASASRILSPSRAVARYARFGPASLPQPSLGKGNGFGPPIATRSAPRVCTSAVAPASSLAGRGGGASLQRFASSPSAPSPDPGPLSQNLRLSGEHSATGHA